MQHWLHWASAILGYYIAGATSFSVYFLIVNLIQFHLVDCNSIELWWILIGWRWTNLDFPAASAGRVCRRGDHRAETIPWPCKCRSCAFCRQRCRSRRSFDSNWAEAAGTHPPFRISSWSSWRYVAEGGGAASASRSVA